MAQERPDRFTNQIGKKYMTVNWSIIALRAKSLLLGRKTPDFGDYRQSFRFGKICCARNRELERVGAESNTASIAIVDLWRERNTNSKSTFQFITDIAACSIPNQPQQLRCSLQ